jgi:hypothetical protein
VNGNLSLMAKLREYPIDVIDQKLILTPASVKGLAPGKRILVCDAYVATIEDGERHSTAFVREGITSIDHHSPIAEYSRQISSTNLALEYVKELGPIVDDTYAIINHTDCDAVLSSLIMRGILLPEDRFGIAAVAADHTGEANEIADVLQSLDVKRDLGFSARNLQLLLEGKRIEPEARALYQDRLANRDRARRITENQLEASELGNVYYAFLDRKIDSGLLPSLKPDAKIIVIFNPLVDRETLEIIPGKCEAKTRLGMAARIGTDLRDIMGFDPEWGGRWNAGSNQRRGVGTEMSIGSYVQEIEKALASLEVE